MMERLAFYLLITINNNKLPSSEEGRDNMTTRRLFLSITLRFTMQIGVWRTLIVFNQRTLVVPGILQKDLGYSKTTQPMIHSKLTNLIFRNCFMGATSSDLARNPILKGCQKSENRFFKKL